MTSYDHEPGFLIDTQAAAAYHTDLDSALASLPSDAYGLDMGCGSGALTQWLWEAGRRVMGADRSEAALAEARVRLPEVSFARCDSDSRDAIQTFSQTHGVFDWVISRYVIHELADPIETFVLWKQLLKPNGVLILIENAWIRSDWGWNEWGRRSDTLPLACTQTWATAAYCLKKAGYAVRECRWLSAVNALESTRLKSGFRLFVVIANPASGS